MTQRGAHLQVLKGGLTGDLLAGVGPGLVHPYLELQAGWCSP